MPARQDEGEPVKLKVCLVGEEGVGKTSLVRRFVHSEFDEQYVRTVGAVVTKRIVLVPIEGETYAANLLVWDILGRWDFASRYRRAYFANAAGVLAVCDLTRPATLDGLPQWLDVVRDTVGDAPVLLLANKADLAEQVSVSEDALLATCERYAAPLLETSAVTGQNVDLAFGTLAGIAVRQAIARGRKRMPAGVSDRVPAARTA